MINITNDGNQINVAVEADRERIELLAKELEVAIYSVSMIWLKYGMNSMKIEGLVNAACDNALDKFYEGGGVLH